MGWSALARQSVLGISSGWYYHILMTSFVNVGQGLFVCAFFCRAFVSSLCGFLSVLALAGVLRQEDPHDDST